ncbi:MAG: hypothetical protein Q7U02_10765 [Desulfosalsimonadaceae bacterium]|nr:hypothetical protein [Desulfosalsimonadaceae bacterium]
MRLHKVIALNQKAILPSMKFQVGCIAIFFCCFLISFLLADIISTSYTSIYPSGADLSAAQGIALSERLSIGHQFIPINSGF